MSDSAQFLLASALITAIAAAFIAAPFVVIWLVDRRHRKRADAEWRRDSRATTNQGE